MILEGIKWQKKDTCAELWLIEKAFFKATPISSLWCFKLDPEIAGCLLFYSVKNMKEKYNYNLESYK
jgi:hypothetical protein